MARYSGVIGFVDFDEQAPGVYVENTFVERHYKGDVLRNTRRWEGSDTLNDNLKINNSISIVADPYAYAHFFAMRYISWMGSFWKITNAEIQRPRIILTIGDVYHGPRAIASENQVGTSGCS